MSPVTRNFIPLPADKQYKIPIFKRLPPGIKVIVDLKPDIFPAEYFKLQSIYLTIPSTSKKRMLSISVTCKRRDGKICYPGLYSDMPYITSHIELPIYIDCSKFDVTGLKCNIITFIIEVNELTDLKYVLRFSIQGQVLS